MDESERPRVLPARRRRRRELERLDARRDRAGVGETKVIVVASTERYRALAEELPRAGDAVLEIGCSTGLTTQVLARRSGRVVAVDVSDEFVERARAALLPELGNVTVAQLDGRDVPGLAALLPEPDVVFVDIGGDAQLDNVALQVRQLLLAFSPRVLVVKSVELGALCSLVSAYEVPSPFPLRRRTYGGAGERVLASLLDLSRGSSTDSRLYAARKLGELWAHEGLKEAAQRLTEMMEGDGDPRVRRLARMKLEGRGGERARAQWRLGGRRGTG